MGNVPAIFSIKKNECTKLPIWKTIIILSYSKKNFMANTTFEE